MFTYREQVYFMNTKTSSDVLFSNSLVNSSEVANCECDIEKV
jgi:hypothetical protein